MRLCLFRAIRDRQRQGEVEIAEKILREEKALEMRKKRQPYLFVDRHKESVKVYLFGTFFHHVSIELVLLLIELALC